MLNENTDKDILSVFFMLILLRTMRLFPFLDNALLMLYNKDY